MIPPETAAASRQRVRRSRKQVPPRAWHSAKVGPAIFAAMTVLAIAYVALGLRAVDFAGRGYGMIGVDLSPADVRYMMGRPTGQTPGTAGEGAQWSYRLPEGGAMSLSFDPADGRVGRLSCEDAAMSAPSCPAVLGLALGTPETEIWFKLGEPSRQAYTADGKTLVYDGLGLAFELKRFALEKIILQRRPDRLSFLPSAIRYLVP